MRWCDGCEADRSSAKRAVRPVSDDLKHAFCIIAHARNARSNVLCFFFAHPPLSCDYVAVVLTTSRDVGHLADFRSPASPVRLNNLM